MSVYWDAHLQLGLFMLTHALDMANGIQVDDLPTYTTTLRRATKLLDDTLAAVDAVGTLSSSKDDVVKNRAL